MDRCRKRSSVIHVYPVDDLREHNTETLMPECLCGAFFDEDCPGMIIHNSFDGREHVEGILN